MQWVGAGLDARGGPLEFIAIETGPARRSKLDEVARLRRTTASRVVRELIDSL